MLLAGSLAAGCTGGSTHAVRPHPTTGSVPRFQHVVVVVLENKAVHQVMGRKDAPYLNSLARSGAWFTNSYAIRHPSQPNYLALFSGSTQGLTDDSCPHAYRSANLAGELRAARLTFIGYSEGLPHTGSSVCSDGRYARKHVPWANFPALPASANRPFTDFPRDYAALPTVAFVIPDLCHDMHDCSVAAGDSWVRANLGGYARWARAHGSLLIVTFDENDGSSGNRIATVFTGAFVKPGRYSEEIDHYGVLRTIEDAFRLARAGVSGSRSPVTDVWTAGRR
ncbi:alkaline phosphatase family protein [Actinomadura darangshiensis]|uniref:alkaline phosphatase family protein n=1 Tax=Actinomadura darangshiensis TaxID=705336 RepID=UPI001A9CF55B|nr:alkaline phosphatase family protein [Actinomadura darangshiensis]